MVTVRPFSSSSNPTAAPAPDPPTVLSAHPAPPPSVSPNRGPGERGAKNTLRRRPGRVDGRGWGLPAGSPRPWCALTHRCPSRAPGQVPEVRSRGRLLGPPRPNFALHLAHCAPRRLFAVLVATDNSLRNSPSPGSVLVGPNSDAIRPPQHARADRPVSAVGSSLLHPTPGGSPSSSTGRAQGCRKVPPGIPYFQEGRSSVECLGHLDEGGPDHGSEIHPFPSGMDPVADGR